MNCWTAKRTNTIQYKLRYKPSRPCSLLDPEIFPSHWGACHNHSIDKPDLGNTDQRHHKSSYQHVRDTTHDLLHFITPAHTMQTCTTPLSARAQCCPWLYTTACTSQLQYSEFILAEWSKFPPAPQYPSSGVKQQPQMTSIVSFTTALSPTGNSKVQTMLWVPCNTQCYEIVSYSVHYLFITSNLPQQTLRVSASRLLVAEIQHFKNI